MFEVMHSYLCRVETLAMGMAQGQSRLVSGESARLLHVSATGFGLRWQVAVTVISSGLPSLPWVPGSVDGHAAAVYKLGSGWCCS